VSVAGAQPRVPAPRWIVDLFGPERIDDATRLGWGFRNETWKVDLADGRRLAVARLAAGETAASIVALTRLVRPRLLAAGVPVPAVVELGTAAAAGVLVTEFVEGAPGAELLDVDGGPALVGSLLGTTWRTLAAIDPTGLPLPAMQGIAADGASSAAGLARANRWLSRSEQRQLALVVDAGTNLQADRQPGFAHGDLAPVNILVRDGALAALLDFESIRLADPLLDPAWFQWIVAFHHPAAEPEAWRAFVASSRLDDGDVVARELLRILPTVRLLEILDDDRLTIEREAHWVRMLRSCLARPR
jgi:aminoglycoside phosphotransferase (APT) family kinase protein